MSRMDLWSKWRVGIGLTCAFIAGFLVCALWQVRSAEAKLDLGDLLGPAIKVIGVKAAIDEYGDEINDAINKLMDNNDAGTNASTKVVTIVSPLGGNKYVGAAQVVGPKQAVDQVRAVLQLETSFMKKLFRIKAVIPIDSEDPTKFKRVEGVGVSAMIDVKL